MGIWDKEIADEVKKQLWVAGPMICVCAKCRFHVCIEKIFLTINVIDRQTHTKHNNIAKVIYKYGQNKR